MPAPAWDGHLPTTSAGILMTPQGQPNWAAETTLRRAIMSSSGQTRRFHLIQN